MLLLFSREEGRLYVQIRDDCCFVRLQFPGDTEPPPPPSKPMMCVFLAYYVVEGQGTPPFKPAMRVFFIICFLETGYPPLKVMIGVFWFLFPRGRLSPIETHYRRVFEYYSLETQVYHEGQFYFTLVPRQVTPQLNSMTGVFLVYWFLETQVTSPLKPVIDVFLVSCLIETGRPTLEPLLGVFLVYCFLEMGCCCCCCARIDS